MSKFTKLVAHRINNESLIPLKTNSKDSPKKLTLPINLQGLQVANIKIVTRSPSIKSQSPPSRVKELSASQLVQSQDIPIFEGPAYFIVEGHLKDSRESKLLVKVFKDTSSSVQGGFFREIFVHEHLASSYGHYLVPLKYIMKSGSPSKLLFSSEGIEMDSLSNPIPYFPQNHPPTSSGSNSNQGKILFVIKMVIIISQINKMRMAVCQLFSRNIVRSKYVNPCYQKKQEYEEQDFISTPSNKTIQDKKQDIDEETDIIQTKTPKTESIKHLKSPIAGSGGFKLFDISSITPYGASLTPSNLKADDQVFQPPEVATGGKVSDSTDSFIVGLLILKALHPSIYPEASLISEERSLDLSQVEDPNLSHLLGQCLEPDSNKRIVV